VRVGFTAMKLSINDGKLQGDSPNCPSTICRPTEVTPCESISEVMYELLIRLQKRASQVGCCQPNFFAPDTFVLERVEEKSFASHGGRLTKFCVGDGID
jgi:hypothetical protein